MKEYLKSAGEQLGLARTTACDSGNSSLKKLHGYNSLDNAAQKSLDKRSKQVQPSPLEEINENAAPTQTTQNRTHT